MPEKLILSYDVGTTALKACIMDTRFTNLGKRAEEYPVYIPEKGHAEQDPLDWWKAVVKTTNELIREKGINVSNIKALVFSGQTLSTVLIGRDGEPLMRSMIWMDARAAPQARKMIGRGLLKLSGYNIFPMLRFLWTTGGGPGLAGKDHLPRIVWVKENMPDLYRDTHKFLDSNGFMIYKATGEAVISRFDAHLTWMMNSRGGNAFWSKSILGRYGIDIEKLPEIKPSTEIAGRLSREAAHELNIPEGIPVVVGAGDVASVAVGSGAVKAGEHFVYIGTSDFMGAHVESRKTDISHYMASVSSAIPHLYLYTGEQETAGTCLDWVKDEIFKEETIKQGDKIYRLLDEAASKISPGSKGLIFTPWLSGEKTPIDNDTIRGGFHNLSIEHTREHMVRAVMEGVALNIRWAFRCMEKKIGEAKSINFVGGGAMSEIWCQIIADVLNRQMRQIDNPREAGARGAAMIAAVALGTYRDFSAAAARIKVVGVFNPNPKNSRLYDRLFIEFKELYERHKSICKEMNRRSS